MTQPLFDAHLHIIDPAFPLVANQGFVPPAFTVADYRKHTQQLNIGAGAIVSGSFQGFDQSYLLHSLQQLGATFVGVTQLPATVSDAELFDLAAHRVRAVRFNVRRGGSESIEQLKSFAARVHETVGWHVEIYADAAELVELSPTLIALPSVSIDHLGLSKRGLPMLLQLVERGIRVKATGFGRVDFDVAAALKQIYAINPEALMFGTDLPSTRAPRAFRPEDVTLITDALGEEGAAQVLWGNAVWFYRIAGRDS